MSKNEGHLVLDIDCNIGPITVIVVGRLEMETMMSMRHRVSTIGRKPMQLTVLS